MTSLASLILKLTSLTRQSHFYLSQYLGAFIHLPHIWRNLHVNLHLSSLSLTVLRLSRQLRLESLIRIGVPPLLKLTGQLPRPRKEETVANEAVIPLDLSTQEASIARLYEPILSAPDPFRAITRTLFQSRPSAMRPLNAAKMATTAEPDTSTSILTSTPQRPPSSARLEHETPSEESLRENVVEKWLRQYDETGRRPTMSFVEAHKLYRDLYEEFVSTAILPPDQFAESFLHTAPNLNMDRAKTELRARLNAQLSEKNERLTLKAQTETETPISSILAPSYIAATLWSKGSLAFGAFLQTSSPPILRSMPGGYGSSATSSSLISEDKSRSLGSYRTSRIDESISHPGTSSSDSQTIKLAGVEGTSFGSRSLVGVPKSETTESETRIPSTSPDHSEQRPLIYSPAAALYSTLAALATTAFISPTQGNGHTSSPNVRTSTLKPPFAIDRYTKTGLTQTVAFTELGPNLTHKEPAIERFERILPVAESHPTPIYLRPPMNLPAVASTIPQRNPPSTLPSSSIAPTRENITSRDLDEEGEPSEENGVPEGYPETEDDSEDAAIREQVRRMGKIIAEEARRHIGST